MNQFLSIFLALVVSASAELIPASRLTTWTPGTYTGVSGGIPTDRTIYGDANTNGITDSLEGIDATGATNVAAEIQSALNAATSGTVVRLPAGTFRIDSQLTMGIGDSGVTLRGAGMNETIIDSHVNSALYIGSNDLVGLPFGSTLSDVTISSGLSVGSQTVTIPSTAGFTNGQIMRITVANDLTLPVVSVYNYDEVAGQIVRLVSKTSTTLTFWPPLYEAYGGGARTARVYGPGNSFYSHTVGVEDLTIDCLSYTTGGGAYAGIEFINVRDSWIKNVKVKNHKNYGFSFYMAVNCEVRQSIVDPSLNEGATSGSGILVNSVSGSLFEDNIILENFPAIEQNQGSSGNVFAFNYTDGLIDTNHTPHNNFTLVEGNTGPGFYHMSDGYFGSEGNLTIARNYSTLYGINLRRFTRNTSAVGNIMPGAIGTGQPFIGNGSSDGTAQLSVGDPWRDWQMTATLTTRTSASGGIITLNSGALFTGGQIIRLIWDSGASVRFANVTAVSGNDVTITDYSGGSDLPDQGTTGISVGPGSYYSGDATTSSYAEWDLDVAATTIDKGNWRTDNSSLSSLGGDTVPASFFRSTKPDFFGSLAWPAFDSGSPGAASYENIPAGYRAINGEEEPAVAMPSVSPAAGIYTSTQNVTLSTSTGGASIYYTTDGTTPDNGDTLYTGPVEISATTTLKSIAYLDGEYSSVRTSVYTIEEEEPAPSGQKRTRVGGKDIRIGGKVIKIGDN